MLSTRNFQMINGLLRNALQVAVFSMTKYSYLPNHKLLTFICSVWGRGNSMERGLGIKGTQSHEETEIMAEAQSTR